MSNDFDKIVNPEKYGLVECPHCNGYGSSLKEEAETCTLCGGSGLVPEATKASYLKAQKEAEDAQK